MRRAINGVGTVRVREFARYFRLAKGESRIGSVVYELRAFSATKYHGVAEVGVNVWRDETSGSLNLVDVCYHSKKLMYCHLRVWGSCLWRFRSLYRNQMMLRHSWGWVSQRMPRAPSEVSRVLLFRESQLLLRSDSSGTDHDVMVCTRETLHISRGFDSPKLSLAHKLSSGVPKASFVRLEWQAKEHHLIGSRHKLPRMPNWSLGLLAQVVMVEMERCILLWAPPKAKIGEH